jgi:hypothetical protein
MLGWFTFLDATGEAKMVNLDRVASITYRPPTAQFSSTLTLIGEERVIVQTSGPQATAFYEWMQQRLQDGGKGRVG